MQIGLLEIQKKIVLQCLKVKFHYAILLANELVYDLLAS